MKTTERKGRLMSQREVSEELGLPTRDVIRYSKAGTFPAPVKKIGKKYWFRRSEVVAWEGRDRRKTQADSSEPETSNLSAITSSDSDEWCE